MLNDIVKKLMEEQYPSAIIQTKDGKEIRANRIRNFTDGGVYMDGSNLVHLTDADNIITDTFTYEEFTTFLTAGMSGRGRRL